MPERFGLDSFDIQTLLLEYGPQPVQRSQRAKNLQRVAIGIGVRFEPTDPRPKFGRVSNKENALAFYQCGDCLSLLAYVVRRGELLKCSISVQLRHSAPLPEKVRRYRIIIDSK